MEEYNVKEDYIKIDNIIESQEKIHKTMSREQLLKDINKECNLNC